MGFLIWDRESVMKIIFAKIAFLAKELIICYQFLDECYNIQKFQKVLKGGRNCYIALWFSCFFEKPCKCLMIVCLNYKNCEEKNYYKNQVSKNRIKIF